MLAVNLANGISPMLCGNRSLKLWDNTTSDFGPCFEDVFLSVPSHFFLAAVSAYSLGGLNPGLVGTRPRLQRLSIVFRMIINIGLSLVTLIPFATLIATTDAILETYGFASILQVCVGIICWSLNLFYYRNLLRNDTLSHRGSKRILVGYLLCLLADVARIRSILYINNVDLRSTGESVVYVCAFLQSVFHGLFVLTLLPPSGIEDNQYEIFDDNARLSLLSPNVDSFNELGVAKAYTPWLSRLFIYWVNPLIKKGRRKQLNSPDDVFNLPNDITSSVASYKIQLAKASHPEKPVKLLRILFKVYGKPFFAVGILKFLADCFGFASPILLNRIIVFMEEKDEDMKWGYIYAVGLSITSFLSALCSTHQNLFIGELGLKIRASVITLIYRHTVSMTTIEMSKFSMGQVINFMSTDMDRIVSFCSSLHGLWSLPFQLTVTLYLLYQQVGISTLAGVVLSLLMIPLNKVIADAIGKMSAKMMTSKDERVKIMSEILYGIKVIKYFTWESYFTLRIDEHRKEELKYLKGRKYLDALCVFLWATTPVLISVLTFSLYAMLGNELTASKVFTSVALFAMLTGPLNAFPWVLNGVIESTVSITRIAAYLSTDRVDRNAFFSNAEDVVPVELAENEVDLCVSKGQFILSEDLTGNNFALSNINLIAMKGDFIGIIGKVGSGKSSLLQALLGEVKKTGGQIYVRDMPKGLAYVHQEPWLQNGTIRDNILFGKSYEEGWFNKVIDACALKQDLDELPNRERTNVGEKGVMLSGGQKARVALARAVYQNKDIYLIDDIFSSVDVPVGNHIYRKCLLGLLKDKTKIVCTHHPRFLAGANKAVVMEVGTIVAEGRPEQILSSFNFDKEEDKASKENTDEVDKDKELAVQVSEEEARESGSVKFDIYKNYWFSVGKYLSPSIILSIIIMQGTKNFADVWLAEWVTYDEGKNVTRGSANIKYYLTVYNVVGALNSLVSLIRAFLFAYGGICAAKVIHEKIFRVILRAKAVFFDNTPVGRIMNRFSSDLYTVDDSLPFILNIFLANCGLIIGPVIVCAYSVPWIALILVPLTFIYFDIQKCYRPASRDLKRMASVSLSPIYAHFSETLGGLQTIRAMKASSRFIQDNEVMLEDNQKSQYAGIAAGQWLEMRLQLIGCAVVTGIAVIAVLEHSVSTISPGYVGLAISYALGITAKLSGLVSSFTETEKQLVAVERCYQYINDVPKEAEPNEEPIALSDWPSAGKVSFQNVSLRYRLHFPLAIDDLSFETRPSEKIGIVGRTGSGKSSIFQTLFRMVNICHGDITIDGVSIYDLSLQELRKHISIIPQDPFLFSGAIRENLDPFGGQSDEALWDSLRKTHLHEVVQNAGGLDALVNERGEGFSVGQRQLFCLARAILSQSKIVCVDEATANVDLETDQLVQVVLRTALEERTVLTIAHRVETIMESDRVFVMSKGKILEIGEPKKLMQNPESAFSKHVANH